MAPILSSSFTCAISLVLMLAETNVDVVTFISFRDYSEGSCFINYAVNSNHVSQSSLTRGSASTSKGVLEGGTHMILLMVAIISVIKYGPESWINR